MAAMTRKGARSVTQTLDRVASLFQQEWKTLGVPERIAQDFAYRCDLLSDRVERTAGLERTALDELDVMKEPGFDPESIGMEQTGLIETVETDEPFMQDEFTQQENRELRERFQNGDLGSDVNPEPEAPVPGKQASFEQVGRDALSAKLASFCAKVQGHASRVGSKDPVLASSLFNLATAVMAVQRDVLTGKTSAVHANRTLQALTLLALDHPGAKFATLVSMATKVVKKAEDAPVEDEEPKEEPKESNKKSGAKGEIPPQFLEHMKKKEDEGAENKDEAKEDEKKGGKKASHGFQLSA